MRHLALLPTVLLLACEPASEEPPAPEPHTLVLSTLGFARAVEGVSRGFDLDGKVTEPGDRSGCSQIDWMGVDGQGGVDNQMARLLPVLDDTEARALEPTIQGAINDGLILILVELHGLDDWENDDEVEVHLFRGEHYPEIGTDGFIEPGQTFDMAPDSAVSVVTDATVRDGMLEVHGLTVDLPIDIFSAHFEINVQSASLRMDLLTEGQPGYFGGAFPYDTVLEGLLNADIDQGLKDLLPGVFAGFSDMDGPNGDCTSMSVTVDFTTARAFVFEDRPADAVE